jgi:hypothetical protein
MAGKLRILFLRPLERSTFRPTFLLNLLRILHAIQWCGPACGLVDESFGPARALRALRAVWTTRRTTASSCPQVYHTLGLLAHRVHRPNNELENIYRQLRIRWGNYLEHNRVSFGECRVEMWRGGGRRGLSVAAPFVGRCLTSRTLTPFPHPPHRTRRADLRHRALGQDLTPSPTARCASTSVGRPDRGSGRDTRGDIRATHSCVLCVSCTTTGATAWWCKLSTTSVVSCPVPVRAVSAWIFSTTCLTLLRDGFAPR